MEFFTIYQAARHCRVSIETLSKWIEDGILESVTTGDGHRRIRRRDLHVFLRRQGMPIPHEIGDSDRKRILVIDDNRLLVETIVTALEEEPHDYEIVSASDGFEAGIQIEEFDPDLLILDIMMPDIDGYEVCRRVKEEESSKRPKVIVLSGYLDEESFEKMRQYGADACFAKPLSLRSLKREVRRVLDMESSDEGENVE